MLEGQLYHYGLGAGVPYSTLNSLANAVAYARNVGDVSRRKSLARELLVNSKWTDFISKETCFARVQPDTLPGTADVIEIIRGIIAERRKTGWHHSRVNPVDHLELPEHFRDNPKLLDFALSGPMLQIMCGYYGMVPQLKEIGIWVTRPQKERNNSQLFHLDKPESQIVGLFLNIENNGVEQGPFTFIPADESRKIRKGTNYESCYFRGDGYLSDEVVEKHSAKKNQISTEGAPGTGIFVDTSHCFHFGSRCREGERILMMVKFMLPHRARKPRTPLFDLTQMPKDEVRRLVLCGTKFGNG